MPRNKSEPTVLSYISARGGELNTQKPRRPRAKFLKRHILPSDTHQFIERIFDLSIVAYNFDSYEEICAFPDVKYALDVNEEVTRVVQRVESLNLAGNMLWPDPLPEDFAHFPVSRYEWLTICADVFLMRYVSVVDCALLLTNTVYELGLTRQACRIEKLKKHESLPERTLSVLEEILDSQGNLRAERNGRLHHGIERTFTQDDQTFRMASIFEHRMNGIKGTDRFGRKILIERMLKEGLVELQREFNSSTKTLVRQMDRLYDLLSEEFEDRFGPRIRAATHGLNAHARRTSSHEP